ncbi:MAG: undecaprenyl-diphosphate phosphatase [Candidatus Nanohaloarchaea archaeon]
MGLVQAVVIGVTQGIFEWLPVSSEAVLTLVMTNFFHQSVNQALNGAIWLHTGTMLAALAYFRKDYLDLLKDIWVKTRNLEIKDIESYIKPDSTEENLIQFLVVSTFFTGLVGGPLYLFGLKEIHSETIFYMITAAALFLTGFLRLYQGSTEREVDEVNWKDSVFVGFLQGFSIIPGISRSGTTTFGLLLDNFDAKTAFKLSFLMSVPAVLIGNIGVELFSDFTVSAELLLAALVAFIVGYLTIETILDIADRAEIAWICFGLGILALAPLLL